MTDDERRDLTSSSVSAVRSIAQGDLWVTEALFDYGGEEFTERHPGGS